ncbi:MAG: hypothetical protein JO199_01475 [Candidatus Eremiobacteraeota bacterium]|nr:hypothetical protein [Candidatus Eremiobacteraeota bacterium]
MANVLDVVPAWAIMLVVAALILVVSEGGSLVAKLQRLPHEHDAGAGVVQNAAFTITGLLLGFSFALALGRDVNRRLTYVQECNAIEATYMRASLLDDSTAKYVREQLREYVGYRIDFIRAEGDLPRRAADTVQSKRLQDNIWRAGAQAERRDSRSTGIPLLLASVTDTIGTGNLQNALLSTHIPDIVIVALVLIALVAAGMMGFVFERAGKKDTAPRILYALVFALSIGLVYDLDRPQAGFVRISLAPMIALQDRMNASP